MGHGHLELQVVQKETTFKDVEIVFVVETFVCSECGLEAGTK
jgi:hypothetical protein